MKRALAVIALLFVAAVAVAQEAVPLAPENQAQAAIMAAFAALLPFGVQLVRTLLPKLPRVVVWGLAPALGTAIGYMSGLGGMTGWKGLGAGLLAIALRELASTIKDHKLG